MNATLESAPQKAKFANIARHLTDTIVSGHFAVGALLPTELELCKHYGTSRHTVRAALQQLLAQLRRSYSPLPGLAVRPRVRRDQISCRSLADDGKDERGRSSRAPYMARQMSRVYPRTPGMRTPPLLFGSGRGRLRQGPLKN